MSFHCQTEGRIRWNVQEFWTAGMAKQLLGHPKWGNSAVSKCDRFWTQMDENERSLSKQTNEFRKIAEWQFKVRWNLVEMTIEFVTYIKHATDDSIMVSGSGFIFEPLTSTPTARVGGLMYSSSNFYAGIT